MRLILDTHVVIWWFTANPRLSGKIEKLVRDPECECFISAVSVYEISYKFQLGKLSEVAELEAMLVPLALNSGMQFLPLTERHARIAALLPAVNRDPFDRFISAQSLVEQIEIASQDVSLSQLGGLRIW